MREVELPIVSAPSIYVTSRSSCCLSANRADEVPQPYRRISQGNHKFSGNTPITLLRDLDQPFIFELRGRVATYRLEFSDTSSPENWQLLRPDIVIICYDISQRLSLINMQRMVRTFPSIP